MARKPVSQETKERRAPCPFCGEPVPEFRTDCPRCLNSLPFCLASGKHLVKEEVTFCPKCNFTANFSYFKRVLEQESECPMCSNPVSPADLKLLGESAMAQLKPAKKEEEEPKP